MQGSQHQLMAHLVNNLFLARRHRLAAELRRKARLLVPTELDPKRIKIIR